MMAFSTYHTGRKFGSSDFLSGMYAVADPGFWSGGGGKIVTEKFADRAKQSHANEVSKVSFILKANSFRALEALGVFFLEYAFSLF